MRRFEIIHEGFVYATGVQWSSGWVALSRRMTQFAGVECMSRMPSIAGAEVRWLDPEPGLLPLAAAALSVALDGPCAEVRDLPPVTAPPPVPQDGALKFDRIRGWREEPDDAD